jgi:hypothetical protein
MTPFLKLKRVRDLSSDKVGYIIEKVTPSEVSFDASDLSNKVVDRSWFEWHETPSEYSEASLSLEK